MSDDGWVGAFGDCLARLGLAWPGRQDPLWTRTRRNRTPGRHTSRALGRFLEALRSLDHPVVLDLGPASGRSVSFLGLELSCKLIVSDLYQCLEETSAGGGRHERSRAIAAWIDQPDASIDGVLCWDLCDYLALDEAQVLAAQIARVLKPGGVVFAMFSTISYEAPEVVRFAMEDAGHITYRPAASAMAHQRVWLSRDVAQLFGGLRTDGAYLLKHGIREVLLRKPRAQVKTGHV